MTATLDSNGVLTISDSEKSEAMPEYYDNIWGGIPDYGGAYPPWYNVRLDIHSIIISDKITTIGKGRAFQDCSNLTSVVIPNSVVAVSSDAFQNCSALTSMTVGWATPFITSFSSLNTSLITLHVPAGTKALYAAAAGWKDFGTIVDDGAPSEKQTWFLTSTMTAALDNEGVLTIATTESSEAMPDYYDSGAPVSKNEIPIWIWANLKVLSVTVENGVTSIGNNSFFQCSDLTSVTLPNSTVSIGGFAFSWCTGLISVSIPDNSVKSIGDYAFGNCTKLASITIPNSVDTIGNNAFSSCSLTSIIIPNSVKSIGMMAFNGCDFPSVSIPNLVGSIGEGAFSSCSSLSTITVDSSNPNYSVKDNVLYNKNQTFLHTYPAGKKDTSFSIPNSVKSIGMMAFGGDSLTSITIPNSVDSIGFSAFGGCTALEDVTVNWAIPLSLSANSNPFYNRVNVN